MRSITTSRLQKFLISSLVPHLRATSQSIYIFFFSCLFLTFLLCSSCATEFCVCFLGSGIAWMMPCAGFCSHAVYQHLHFRTSDDGEDKKPAIDLASAVGHSNTLDGTVAVLLLLMLLLLLLPLLWRPMLYALKRVVLVM